MRKTHVCTSNDNSDSSWWIGVIWHFPHVFFFPCRWNSLLKLEFAALEIIPMHNLSSCFWISHVNIEKRRLVVAALGSRLVCFLGPAESLLLCIFLLLPSGSYLQTDWSVARPWVDYTGIFYSCKTLKMKYSMLVLCQLVKYSHLCLMYSKPLPPGFSFLERRAYWSI